MPELSREPAIEPGSPDSSASASSILRYLTQLDTSAKQFPRTLSSMLNSDDFAAFVSSLRDDEIIVFIDFVDRALDSVLADDDLSRKCLRWLRKICGQARQLPTSHIISDGLAKTSDTAVAAGGFADVWAGSYRELPVALKSLRIYAVDDQELVQKKFCKEVVVWKRLSHPNVLRFLGVSTTVFPLCMVSEWMANGNIVQYLKSHPETNRLDLLLDVANGLEYLHSSHVVHGDLKGPNIVIDDSGRAQLADFGLASITGDSLSLNASTPDQMRGTARWMSPELLNPLDHAPSGRPTKPSDIFALAMVVIEVFSGRVPFPGSRNEVVVFKILKGIRPEKPEEALGLGLSDGVWEIVQRCWLEAPDQRPSISDVVHCFTRAISTFAALSVHAAPTPILPSPVPTTVSAETWRPSPDEPIPVSRQGSRTLSLPDQPPRSRRAQRKARQKASSGTDQNLAGPQTLNTLSHPSATAPKLGRGPPQMQISPSPRPSVIQDLQPSSTVQRVPRPRRDGLSATPKHETRPWDNPTSAPQQSTQPEQNLPSGLPPVVIKQISHTPPLPTRQPSQPKLGTHLPPSNPLHESDRQTSPPRQCESELPLQRPPRLLEQEHTTTPQPFVPESNPPSRHLPTVLIRGTRESSCGSSAGDKELVTPPSQEPFLFEPSLTSQHPPTTEQAPAIQHTLSRKPSRCEASPPSQPPPAGCEYGPATQYNPTLPLREPFLSEPSPSSQDPAATGWGPLPSRKPSRGEANTAPQLPPTDPEPTERPPAQPTFVTPQITSESHPHIQTPPRRPSRSELRPPSRQTSNIGSQRPSTVLPRTPPLPSRHPSRHDLSLPPSAAPKQEPVPNLHYSPTPTRRPSQQQLSSQISFEQGYTSRQTPQQQQQARKASQDEVAPRPQSPSADEQRTLSHQTSRGELTEPPLVTPQLEPIPQTTRSIGQIPWHTLTSSSQLEFSSPPHPPSPPPSTYVTSPEKSPSQPSQQEEAAVDVDSGCCCCTFIKQCLIM